MQQKIVYLHMSTKTGREQTGQSAWEPSQSIPKAKSAIPARLRGIKRIPCPRCLLQYGDQPGQPTFRTTDELRRHLRYDHAQDIPASVKARYLPT